MLPCSETLTVRGDKSASPRLGEAVPGLRSPFGAAEPGRAAGPRRGWAPPVPGRRAGARLLREGRTQEPPWTPTEGSSPCPSVSPRAGGRGRTAMPGAPPPSCPPYLGPSPAPRGSREQIPGLPSEDSQDEAFI